MKIGIGADHRGFKTKLRIANHLRKMGHSVVDYGTDSEAAVDYPDIAVRVAEDVAKKKTDYGLLLCFSGQGMVMSANKVRGVRAAFGINKEYASFARAHNNANVLVMPAGFLKFGKIMKEMITTFLNTKFEGGRHRRRINKMKRYEDSSRSV
jgi:ribose 5-phosphate isomerase B